ncbi:MAG: cbb3-type cytochrome c oxidase subunit II, partial [Gemmatimonadales bacterium]
DGFNVARWLAWAALALGLILFAVRTLVARSWQFEAVFAPSVDTEAEPGDLNGTQIALAAALVMGVAFLVTVITPALDASDEQASLLAVSSRDYAAFADGRPGAQAQDLFNVLGLDVGTVAEGWKVYVSEGCVYCHTQQVRANVTDVGLGAVTQRQDIILENPLVLGRLRLGPDLAHTGLRPQTDNVGWVKDHLTDPRQNRRWSLMPAYDYLTNDELEALAQYVVSLQ